MKVFLLIFILLSQKTLAACLSGSLTQPMNLNFDLKKTEEAIQDFEVVYKAELPPHLSLIINLETLNPRVNAEIVKKDDDVVIEVLGGMLMHPKMSNNTLKLLLCHEIGHLLGGPPLKSRNGWSSTEGQADYYSSSSCFKLFGLSSEEFFEAAISLTQIYAEVTRVPAPALDSCDENVVTRTNYGYPSVQCRLDTLVAGWNGQLRPRCWFRD